MRENRVKIVPMKRLLLSIAISVGAATAASADFETGRTAFFAGDFETAYRELYPEAEAGHADAQEIVGIYYALGIGRDVDYDKAFDWYMKSSLQGHAGAQSGVGWYYEVGLGSVPVDFVKAHMWYTLSTIGGDPDAAISLEDLETEMTREQIVEAQQMAAEYLAQ